MCVCVHRKQEGLVLVLDVGPAMRSVLPDVEKACSMLLQKKVYDLFLLKLLFMNFGSFLIGFGLLLQLIYNKYDEVGIVVFGTEGLSIYSYY